MAEDSSGHLSIGGGLLARNTLINLMGKALPLVVAVVSMPFIIEGLGAARFGVLGILWMLLGYFGALGFRRATTKFVAEALGRGDEAGLRGVVWTTVAIQAALGLALGAALALAAPLLVGRVLNIPLALLAEARTSVYLVAAVLPVVLVGGSFLGVLEAAQRFDLINAVLVPAGMANFLLPLLGLALGWGLPGILALLFASRVVVLVACYALVVRVRPELRGRPGTAGAELRTLLAYGSWASVSGIVSPLLTYLDRFMLGALVSMSAVAYYTVPYELVTRLWVVPMSLVTTLFPAFSTLAGREEWQRLDTLVARSAKYVLLALGPIVIVFIAGAGDILRLWVGAEFARQSALALQILALGVLINSLAFAPFSLIQGVGRADIPAKIHLLELPIQILLIFVLVRAWGIPGAALAWSIRVALDAVLLYAAAARVATVSVRSFVAERVPQSALLLLGFGLVATTLAGALPTLGARALAVALLSAALLAAVWGYALGARDRANVVRLIQRVGART